MISYLRRLVLAFIPTAVPTREPVGPKRAASADFDDYH